MKKQLKVAELFAGVGGFRLALETVDKNFYKTVYANQYEPSTKKQHSFEVYENNFGGSNENQFHDNSNIIDVNEKLAINNDYVKSDIDLVVGGFPCQDYSVATSQAKGMVGKKGVLFWEIIKFVKVKKPDYLILENVDRLLISPKPQRGRDFLIMLKAFNDLNYNVEWHVINAADYGFPQRRKRVILFIYKDGSEIMEKVEVKNINNTVLTKNFNIEKEGEVETFTSDMLLNNTIIELSDSGKFEFKHYGYMKDGIITTFNMKALYDGKKVSLQDILQPTPNVDEAFFLNEDKQERMFATKDGKRVLRTKPNGETYYYTEGVMSRHDNLENRPARTMLTSEGTVNRSTHIILTEDGRYRFITPLESERINMFPDNWTASCDSKSRRYFMMGNALVVGVIEGVGKALYDFLK